MKGIRARRKAERPVEILEAAFQEFVAKGFAATRLEDVAKRVGITKGTIYFYFGSKSAVFERCVRMVAENSAAQFAATAAEWTDNFEADVRGYLARIYRFLDDTPQAAETMRLLVAEASRLPHLVDAYFEHLMDPILENLRKRIALAVAVGEIPEPPRFLPEMVLSPPMAYLVVKLLFDDRRDYDTQTIFESHLHLLLNGLIPTRSKSKNRRDRSGA